MLRSEAENYLGGWKVSYGTGLSLGFDASGHLFDIRAAAPGGVLMGYLLAILILLGLFALCGALVWGAERL